MPDAMATRGEQLIRQIVEDHGDKYQIVATCGSDFIVCQYHKPTKTVGADALFAALDNTPHQDIGYRTAITMRDVLRDVLAAGVGPATSIQYLLQCLEHWVDQRTDPE